MVQSLASKSSPPLVPFPSLSSVPPSLFPPFLPHLPPLPPLPPLLPPPSLPSLTSTFLRKSSTCASRVRRWCRKEGVPWELWRTSAILLISSWCSERREVMESVYRGKGETVEEGGEREEGGRGEWKGR